jgi:hypothetical protein
VTAAHRNSRRRKARRGSLAGTNLYVDTRTGIYVWRRTDEKTGRRVKRSTGTPSFVFALKRAADFEDDYQRVVAGLTVYDCWKKELRPLAEKWMKQQERELGAAFYVQKRMRLYRALDTLKLKFAADLENVAKLHDRLLALEGDEISRTTLRRCYQDVLRQFAAWLAQNGRYLDRNPLATWDPIKLTQAARRTHRRAFLPDQVARALLASDRLDEIHKRKHVQRPIFLALLVTAARTGALVSREVEHLSPVRINLGPDVGKKRRGAAALDPGTALDLATYVGSRKTGRLFLSADSTAIAMNKLRSYWRKAFSLGVVDALWPADEPGGLELAHYVSASLLAGRPRVSKGGNPQRIKRETDKLLERRALEARVTGLMQRLHAEWSQQMEGLDVYSLRMTHRTWAEYKGVPAILIDKQLGHANNNAAGTDDFARMLAGSRTGRDHYLDVQSPLFDPSVSAKAVRELLDDALRRIGGGRTLLLATCPLLPRRPGEVAAILPPMPDPASLT